MFAHPFLRSSRAGVNRLLTRTVWSHLMVATVAAASVTARAAHAQIVLPGSRPQDSAVPGGIASGSPRASFEQFIRLVETGDLNAAAGYIVAPSGQQSRAAELAQRVKRVFDQRADFDVQVLSPLAVGDTTDGDPDTDQIGVIATAAGDIPIVLVRSTNRVPVRWRVSAATVARIDSIYPTLGAPWMRDRIPATLMREGPLHVFLWQWLGLAIAIPLLMLLAYVLGEALRSVLLRVVLRTEAKWDDQLLDGLRRPFRLMVVALGVTPIVELLQINVRVASFINAAARGLVLIAIFWGLLRLIRIAQKRMEANAFEHGQVQARTLIPLLGNFLRVTLTIVAMLVALAQFGYPVGTLLTGLGIGGIAIALAAQKTVEHLFGSVSLAADKAFRVGDWVRAGATEGAVERIGLRSTSFRTNERTVVRIPNGKLADERIETFGERDRMLMRTELDLTYQTTPVQLDAIRDEIEATLRAHAKIWAETVMVHVVAFTESSIRIKVMAWFETTNHPEFLRIRHEMYLEFMRIIERNGSSFAFPTRTLHVVGDQQAVAQTPFKGSVTPADETAAPRDDDQSDAKVSDDGDTRT